MSLLVLLNSFNYLQLMKRSKLEVSIDTDLADHCIWRGFSASLSAENISIDWVSSFSSHEEQTIFRDKNFISAIVRQKFLL